MAYMTGYQKVFAAAGLEKYSSVNRLFHVSSWPDLKHAKKSDTFVLKPGPQGAEGSGVYFSEGSPRMTAAEGAGREGYQAVISAELPETPKGWWRTKPGIVKKFNRPRTWHSDGSDVRFTVNEVAEEDDLPLLRGALELIDG